MEGNPKKIFVDTNILVYAYDIDSGQKHLKAKKVIQSCIGGKTELFVSNQVLAEFAFVTLNKIKNPVAQEEVNGIIKEINVLKSWRKINYSAKTVENIFLEKGRHFWDKLIAATMKENGVFTIFTENTADFKEMNGITAINPLL